MKDIYSNIGMVQSTVPAVLAATTTDTGIDLQGFNSALVIVTTGAIVGDGDYTTKLQESDALAADYTDVDAAYLLGSFPATLEAASIVKVGYVGNKRYIRTVTTKNGGTSIAAAIVVVKGHPNDAPVA
ncbi:hypothetical protein AQS8620_01306 [Aquimixticola soesokkakensis]|uniref:Uncharacterized protein n=1 Tax=Aquimixticola soesokkakensis TaxID=1519096 RepID=A0A1Y5SC64_9RHOB|nr:hypothetical protein [Aquimixticola soesokkakensis]SLN36625.1 hypothetical protein AQS8620_01306 [Aquimixticola soesokkakensis]